jgi:hemoglobin
MQTGYEAAGGADGLLRLANAWHARVMPDEVVSHGFHPEHSQRLAAYWAESLGDPTTYSDCYGDETSVVRMHSGNGPHQEMDRRGVACFDRALVDVGLAIDNRLRQVLHDYFAWTTVTTMSHTTGPQRTSRTGFTSRGGRGTDLSTGDGTSRNPPLPPLVVSATRLIS